MAPFRERFWVSPTLILLPLILSVLLCLPVPLMSEVHSLIAIPGGKICGSHSSTEFTTYQFAIAIIGFYLPAAIVIFLTIGLSIRRCISCSAGRCASSFCKEEIVLALITLPYIPAYLALYLPLLDNYLQRLDIGQSNLQDLITPERARAAEMTLGLVLPLVIFILLSPYRRFGSKPDLHDLKWSNKQEHAPSAAGTGNRLSQASFDMDMSHRNSYYQQ